MTHQDFLDLGFECYTESYRYSGNNIVMRYFTNDYKDCNPSSEFYGCFIYATNTATHGMNTFTLDKKLNRPSVNQIKKLIKLYGGKL